MTSQSTHCGRAHRWLGALAACLLVTSSALAARFEHPSGLGFDYPGNWQLQSQEDLLILSPPDARGGQDQELILVGGENLGGITRVDDPRLLQWFDQQMQSLLGPVRRGGFQSLGGSGARIDYSAGQATHVVRYRFKGPLGVFVVHVNSSAGNARVADQVFASLGGELARDPNLVGLWTRTSTSGTDITYTGGGSGSFVASETRKAYRFAADGKVLYSASSTIFGQVSGAGANSTLLGEGDPNVDRGEYVANGETLWILWADGAWSEWQYRVFQTHDGGIALKLTTPGSKKPIYYERR